MSASAESSSPQLPSDAAPAGGALVLDGKATALAIQQELAARVSALRARAASAGRPPARRAPGLAVVLVGSRADRATYVRMKVAACAAVGIADLGRSFPESATTAELVAAVRALDGEPAVHGILVQLPLPAHVDEAAVLAAISPPKDADGLADANMGAAVLKGRRPGPRACTPLGVIALLRRAGVRMAGARAVVLGRSNIVGVPVAHMLLQEDATVTIAHSKTRDLPALCRSADILVAAIGRPLFVQGDWVRPGAVVIDVGINAVPDASRKSGSRLVGDVDYAAAAARASAITPVPGGVGPMTIAMLLTNTVDAYERELDAAIAAAAAAAAGAT